MTETKTEGCPERVSDHTGFYFHQCGRPIKRNGKCGIHARADEKRTEQSDMFDANYARQREAAEKLKTLGVNAWLVFDHNGSWVGRVSLSLEDLERLVAGAK